MQGLSGTITSATLRIYANSSSSTGYDVRSVSDTTWGETTVNFNNAPAMGSVINSSGAFSTNSWTTVDVTAYITGNGLYSLALSTTSTTAISFASREDNTHKPELVITFGGTPPPTTPPPTPTATQTPTVTHTPSQTPVVTSTLRQPAH